VRFPDNLWGQALERFVAAAPEHGRAYEAWLARTALDSVTDSEVTVVAEDTFTAEWIAQKYRDPLVAMLSAVAGRPVALTVRAEGQARAADRAREGARSQPDLFATDPSGDGPRTD
jgi:chromosomal replication initiation ATPase DnaA